MRLAARVVLGLRNPTTDPLGAATGIDEEMPMATAAAMATAAEEMKAATPATAAVEMQAAATATETAAAVASDLCKAPTASGLRIAPKRGAAVLFLSASPEADGGILWNMWHGGCRVQRGEKWTMQQFKELPI